MGTQKSRLYRLTKPMQNGCTHAGEVWIHGRMWTLTARVVETEHGKQFELYPEAPGAAIAKKLAPKPPSDDLVSQADGMPFNDDLTKVPF